MTKNQIFSSFILLVVIGLSSASAQKFMKVDESLSSVTPEITGYKGLHVIPYYKFGSYQIVHSKSGWSKSRSSGSFLGQVSSESQKLSFKIMNAKGDTSHVSMAKTAQMVDIGGFKGFSMTQGNANVVSTINTSSDDSEWSIATSWGTSGFSGGIKADSSEYEIRIINEWASGKSNFLRAVTFMGLGFGIYLEGIEIAAVQTVPVKSGIGKYAVWINPALAESEKLKLAATCMNLLVIVEQNLLTK